MATIFDPQHERAELPDGSTGPWRDTLSGGGTRPKIYSPEEMDILLGGDRRQIDSLMLHTLNDLGQFLIMHDEDEVKFRAYFGEPKSIEVRAEWIHAQIARQKVRNAMMQRVVAQAGTAFLIAFLAFAGWAILDAIWNVMQQRHK